MSLLHALQNTTVYSEAPFRHWEIDKPLEADMLNEIVTSFVPGGPRAYDGTRAADNGGGGFDGKMRCYVDRKNVHEFPGLGRLIDELLSPETILYIENEIRRDLNDAYLRLEVIADRKGFWLKPHKDIKEKLMSMLLYADVHGESENLGTDLYDADLNLVKTVPYRHNHGYMFAPGDDTWHGLEKKEIKTERRSILINYVTFETDWKLPKLRRAVA